MQFLEVRENFVISENGVKIFIVRTFEGLIVDKEGELLSK